MRAAVALGELVAQVGERRDRAGAERDRLLDLEVARDAVALDAAAVLDRDEREELQQLLGAARGLLGRERRGGEALERGVGAVQRGGEPSPAAGSAAKAARALRSAAAPRSSA